VRGKDNAENEKTFIKIADMIKAAGVSHTVFWSTCQYPIRTDRP
jgi:hypothetical protein